MGEKKRHSDTSSSSSSDEDGIITSGRNSAAQGVETADIVVGDKKISTDKDMTEKQKKKMLQQEAKKKRDAMVSNMTQATEQGLGALADMIERFTK
jgi:hypothetical protein